MPNIEKVTEIYNGVSVECAHLTIDKAGQTYRFSKVFDTTSEYNMVDDYAWQMIAKANGNKSITLTVGDKNTTFSLTTAFARYTNIFYSVNPSTYPYVEIVFPTTGEYWFYHVQLEHGNTITDWHSETEDAVIIATENMTEAVKKWTTFYDTKFEKTDESIKLNARAITANADNIKEVRSDMEASFIVQADQISSIVSDIETLDGKVDTNNSTITQRADRISSSVTALSTNLTNNYYTKSLIDQKSDKITLAVFGKQSGDFSVDDVVNNINSSASVVIGQGHIDLQGYVTFTNLSGAQSASNNTIINGSHLTTGIIGSGDSNTQWNLSSGVFTMRKGSLNLGLVSGTTNQYNFQVTDAGALTARNATITGGSITIKDGNTETFKVTNKGELTATKATISGENSSISITNGSSTIFSANKNGASITGSVSITGNLSAGNGKFYVDGNTGNVHCNKIYGVLDNGTRTNDIYFQMGKDAIYNSGSTDIMISNKLVARELYIKGGVVQINGSEKQSIINLTSTYDSDKKETSSIMTPESIRFHMSNDVSVSQSLKSYDDYDNKIDYLGFSARWFSRLDADLDDYTPSRYLLGQYYYYGLTITDYASSTSTNYVSIQAPHYDSIGGHLSTGQFYINLPTTFATGNTFTVGGSATFNGATTFGSASTFNSSVILSDGTATAGTRVYDGTTLKTLKKFVEDNAPAASGSDYNFSKGYKDYLDALASTSSTTGVSRINLGTTVYVGSSTLSNYARSSAVGSTATGSGDFYTAIKNSATTSVISGTASENRFTYQQYGKIVFINILFHKVSTTSYATSNAGISIAIPKPDGQYNAALCGTSNSGRFFIKSDSTIHFRLPAASDYYAGCLIYNAA